jgi:hypothetical protein
MYWLRTEFKRVPAQRIHPNLPPFRMVGERIRIFQGCVQLSSISGF